MGPGKAFCQALAMVLGLVCLSAKVGSSMAPLHVKSENYRIPGNYIVVLKDDADVDSFTREFKTSVRSGVSEGTIGRTYRHTIKGFSAQLTPKTLNRLRVSDSVKYIEENGIVHASAVSSWGLDRVDQRDLPLDSSTPDYLGDGSGTHMYIIDTGTSSTHQEFGANYDPSGFDAIGNEIGVDCNGHGTHCGGTAGGATYGVAPGVKIHSVRVLDCEGSGTNAGVIDGMEWVAANGVAPAVASMSLGGGYSQAVNDAVTAMVNAGIVVSVAAGNEDTDACDRSPASAPEAITVGATDNTDTRAYFSNYGDCVDIFAPGVSITSAWIGSDSNSETISGTSMACPHVSGAAAVLLGVDSSLTPTDVTNQLLRGSTLNKVSDAQSVNRFLYIGKETCMTRCGAAQDAGQSCQCDAACSSRSDCCSDYGYLCGANAPVCKDRCDSTDSSYPCKCDTDCSSRGDCCPDYEMECVVSPPGDSGCDETLDAEGFISSPNYPSPYPNNQKYHSCITAGAGEKVILTFHYFDLEYEDSCGYDMLRIYDGSDGASPLLGAYCGYHFVYPDYIQSTGESLYVVFQSDESVTHYGFEAEINFLGSESCDETINSEGAIASPNYAGHYLNDQICYTLITAGAGETIVLNYVHFDIEYESYCSYDSLSVYDGSDDSSNILGVYCGDWWDVPYYDQTSGANAYLVFQSDYSVVGGGYVIDVEFSQVVMEKKIKPTMGIPEQKPTMGIPEKKAYNQGKPTHGKHKAPKPVKI